jgi:long-chain acyl-CoA synthetase
VLVTSADDRYGGLRISISLLLEMALSADAERVALISDDMRLTTERLNELATGGAGVIEEAAAEHVVYVGTGGPMLPVLLFAAASAGRPFTPLNYRLAPPALRTLVGRLPRPLVIVDEKYRAVVENADAVVLESQAFLAMAARTTPANHFVDPDDVGVVLFTSGTTSAPKAVELTHNNLSSYITGTVEFASAAAEDSALICLPPYHIAGVSAVMSNLYAGRKMVYLRDFDAVEWVRLVERESVTSATVVPTMLERIVAVLKSSGSELPSLRTLAYGGSRVGLPLVREALKLLPHVGFVNAYGLTETSSTLAVLTPEDHRQAMAALAETTARRLGSVGRPVSGVEVQIRDEDGVVVGPGEVGELFVRGEQISGRYTGIGSVLDENGWFPTRDLAEIDGEGYIFVMGRSDDTIIRGGENIAPAEVEDVLVEHPDVREVAVVGLPDDTWGQTIVAVVVPVAGSEPDVEELRAFVRARLRGSRTPDRIVFRDDLPSTPTGKVLRREIIDSLADQST